MPPPLKDRIRALRYQLAGHTRRPLDRGWLEPVRGVGLEIGGPSAAFGRGGVWPVYQRLARVDGLQYAAETSWHTLDERGSFPTGVGRDGALHIGEASDLSRFEDRSYDAVLSGHVIEHLANPLGALAEWQRVLRPGGCLVTVLPHWEGTFDHRRPLTTLEHLKEDRAAGTPEGDETHVEESIRLHDLARDPVGSTPEQLRERLSDVLGRREIHHHTFSTHSALRMLDAAGFQLLRAKARWPHDIFILARRPVPGTGYDNSVMLARDAPFLRQSPFLADREGRG